MNILLINACVRKGSRTKILADAVVNRLISKYASSQEYENISCSRDITVKSCDIEKENILPLNSASLSKREALIAVGDYSDDMFRYAKELKSADIIVIAAPFWDLSFPAGIKNYIEQTMVNGLVFGYDAQGRPLSLCRASKMIYVSTAGGPVFKPHHGYEYIKSVSEYFWGVRDHILIQAENLDIAGADTEKILKEKLDEISRL